MKLMLFAVMSLCLLSETSWATCKSSGVTNNHTTEVVVDEVFPVTQKHTSAVTVHFAGIKCDSANDKISYLPLVKESVIGPFSNGQSLKLNIVLDKTSEAVGTTNTTEKSLLYTVTLTPATTGSAGSGGESISVPGVLVANTGGNSNGFIDIILGFCKSLSLSGCVNYITNSLKGDSYVENLTVIYRPKKTTCRAGDLTLTLPDVSLSELPDSGMVDKSSKGDISLYCSNMVGVNQQATQAMSVYLYSADLITESRTVLQGSPDNGVGFVVSGGGKKQIQMSTVKGVKENADNLWYAAKGTSLSAQVITIPVEASYYVYARKAVKPGALKATALIFVNYE